MCLKVIRCRMREGAEAAFDAGQVEWSRLASLDGFCAQFGGWCSIRPHEAFIVGIWRDAAACDAFMRDTHDAIADAAAQAETYDEIRVARFEVALDMPGTRDGRESSMLPSIRSARALRFADCRVRPDRFEHFAAVQRDVWRPGVRDTGMLGGYFSVCADNSSDNSSKDAPDGSMRAIVTTLWPDDESHTRYTETRLPALRARATRARTSSTSTAVSFPSSRLGLSSPPTEAAGRARTRRNESVRETDRSGTGRTVTVGPPSSHRRRPAARARAGSVFTQSRLAFRRFACRGRRYATLATAKWRNASLDSIVQREPELDRCEKWFTINRIIDPAIEVRLRRQLDAGI